MNKSKFIFFIVFCIAFGLSGLNLNAQMVYPIEAQADAPKSIDSIDVIKSIPVLDDGRVKPFQTFARHVLLVFSGIESYKKESASHWMVKLLFSPSQAVDDKVFLINDPQIAIAIGLEPVKRRRYSYTEIFENMTSLLELVQAASSVEQKHQSQTDKEIIRIFNNVMYFSNLSQSFQFAFPHQDFTVNDKDVALSLKLPRGLSQFSFLDIALAADQIHEQIKTLETKELTDWSIQEQITLGLLSNLFAWAQQYHDMPFKVIPSQDKEETWFSPWDAIAQEFQKPKVRQDLVEWRNAVIAYWEGDQKGFDQAINGVIQSAQQRPFAVLKKQLATFNIELLYNKLNLFFWSNVLYILALAGFCLSFIWRFKWWRLFSFWILIFGLVLNSVAIIFRILIMHRPPVSTLYETFIFVAAIAVLLGILIEMITKKWLGIIVGSIGGIALLTIAGKYAAEGDTMGMLIAVLNSNFWLTTHVLTITIGYGACCVAGLVGHVYLVQRIVRPNDTKLFNQTMAVLLGSLGLGLVLTFLGTNLGGIWADQSWGRFWGWDPKENGALMIVLWIAALFHAKIGRMIGPIGMAIGSVINVMVVMWAWFGVNLLNIGLHSYGFTSGVGLALMIYYVVEVAFLVVVLGYLSVKEKISDT